MPDFTHESNYSEETSFSQVLFGSSAPVLETEMNELQEIISSKFKKLNSILGNGIYSMGHNASSFNPNTNMVTVRDCIVISEELFVYIDSVTTIVSEENPIIYVALSETTVTGADTLKSYGNTAEGSNITNPIYDNRLGAETSRRKIITYTLASGTTLPTNTATTKYVMFGKLGDGDFIFNVNRTLNIQLSAITNSLSNKASISHTHSFEDITGSPLPIEKGGTGENDRYNAYNNLTLTIHGTVNSLNDLKESGWNYVTVYNNPNLEIPSRDDKETPIAGFLYNINPYPDVNSSLMQIWIDFGYYNTTPNIAIRRTTSSGTSENDITFYDWVKVFTEKSVFLNRSYIKENSSRVFDVFGVATGGSGSYEYTYYYQEDNGNLNPVVTNTTSHKFIDGGVRLTFNSSTTDAYIKVKVKDTDTMEVQTKEFEIKFESE